VNATSQMAHGFEQETVLAQGYPMPLWSHAGPLKFASIRFGFLLALRRAVDLNFPAQQSCTAGCSRDNSSVGSPGDTDLDGSARRVSEARFESSGALPKA